MFWPPQSPCVSRRRGGIAAVIAICLLGLTGCIKINVDVSVRHDDTVDGTIVAAVRAEAIDILGPKATDSFLTSLTADVPGATHAHGYNDGTFIGKKVRFSEIPLEEFGVPGDRRSRDSGLAVRHVLDRYIVTGEWNLPGPSRDRTLDAIDRSVLESARFTVSVAFPGQVTDHNGRLSGRTVTWELSLGQHHELHAVAAESHAARAALVAFAVCSVIIAIVATLLLVQLRRHSLAAPFGSEGRRPRPG